jgi:hypothetical protein
MKFYAIQFLDRLEIFRQGGDEPRSLFIDPLNSTYSLKLLGGEVKYVSQCAMGDASRSRPNCSGNRCGVRTSTHPGADCRATDCRTQQFFKLGVIGGTI